MAPELELNEAWVRDHPALRGHQPEQVGSLSLQGTYAGKIVSLGDGLKCFKNLKALDLSKNLLVSLEGLESLPYLELLNLYYNHISSLLEVARLQTLPRLRELDLRLNPVTRNEPDYRLFTVSKLQALEKLDDRAVRENERKAAHLHFSFKNKENLSQEEKSREHTMRSHMRDQEIFTLSNLDAENIRMLTEHRLLSSSSQARTSLRSPVRSRVGSGKGRYHVTFSKDSSSDFSHGEKEIERKLNILDFGQDVSPSRRVNSNYAGKLHSHGSARDLRQGSYDESLHLASSAAHKEQHKRPAEDRKTADNVHNYNSKVVKEALVATRSSCGDFQGQYLDSNPDNALKHSSDAKLNSHFFILSNPSSASLGDFHPKCRSLLDEIPPEDSQPVSAPISVAQKGQEPPVSRSHSPSRVEFKRSKSPMRCFKEANKEHQHSEQKSGHIRTENPLGAENSSPVIIVLQQLLELVDRYWDGAGSLLLNKDFLTPARDLLRSLKAPLPSQQDSSSTAVAAPSSNSTDINYRIPKDLPKYSQHFSGVDKLVKKLEEGQGASFKEPSGKASAPLNYDHQRKHSFSYGELLSRNEQLSAQVDILTSELNQFKNQQDTISLLRESQKSLISTNGFLLQQLNREQVASSAKGALLSENTASAKGPFFEKTSHRAPSSSAFGSSQLCSSQQLSRSPL